MRTKNRLIVILAILIICSVNLLADRGRLLLDKEYPLSEERLETQRRIHPAEQELRSGERSRDLIRIDNFNRLLVLLIDFQEDNDPRTTGNGKFLLEPDPEYPITLGAPPHDYEYIEAHLEAMKYYYLASSLGNYELSYDIYPREADPKFAYTLPQQMGYYNPGLDNYDLFIERIEEYFRDVFTIADSYGEIQFGDYGHYMIIHAGSDWQHDIFGDTPSDLPSFFIQVGEGKEVWVNDGTVKITNASNVPETISQDGRYGVINAVMAHEFGHSLGFVDLYNVNNFYPAVGYWDIMDSGGMGRLVTIGSDGNFYAIEGGLPALPGAWHRLLVWGDYFRDMGVVNNIHELPIGTNIQLSASSRLYDQNNPLPYIVKVPLSSSEYLLLENRHVDPDGDGGIAFVGAAPITPGGQDYRVLLHPTGVYDDDLEPIYEYDWLLPGWINRYGESFGGGIIAWHIDEKVIYEEGVIDSEGNFRSNYNNNSINTRYSRRGIRIIEADNLPDIGNPYSWYWYGTEYEPYFRYRPHLDSDGYFLNWSYEEFNSELSSQSVPALLTNQGYPSIFRIYDIGASAGVMSFKYTLEPFEYTAILSNDIDLKYLAPPARSTFLSTKTEIPMFTGESVIFTRHIYEPENDLDYWDEFFGEYPFPYLPTQPVISYAKGSLPTKHYVTVGERVIKIFDNVGDFQQTIIDFQGEVVESPLLIEREDELYLVVSTDIEIIIYSDSDEGIIATIPLENARISYSEETLFAVSDGQLYLFEVSEILENDGGRDLLAGAASYEIPGSHTFDYYPVNYRDEFNSGHNALFITNGDGEVFKYHNNQLKHFFTVSQYTDEKPTQLALANYENKVLLFFAAGSYLFAADIYGNLARGYPRSLENRSFKRGEDIRILEVEDNLLLVLPVEDGGYLLYEHNRGIIPEYSMIWDRPDFPDHFFWEEDSERLYFFFADSNNNVYENVFRTTTDNSLIWNGYRNDGTSLYRGVHIIDTTLSETLMAYAFPNPVRGDEVRVRVEGAGEKIELQLYDIVGKRLFNRVYDDNIDNKHDIIINTSNLTTGVYFGIIKTAGKTSDFRIAVEK